MLSSAFLLSAVLVVLSQAARPKWSELNGYTFEQYEKDFNKAYDPKERTLRSALFAKKLRDVMEFNAKPGMSWKKGINHLSDRTQGELNAMRGNHPMHQSRPAVAPVMRSSTGAAPFEVNYAKAIPPILTAIKDQGQCGSCWAHAATEQVETYAAIATGKLFVLSQQQLVSCVENTQQCGGTGGCAGATAEVAFDYLTTKGGMTQEWMYGYQSYFGDVPSCAFDPSKTVPIVKLNGYTLNSRNDPAVVVNSLATTGPLAISVDASKWSDYESGVYQGCDYAQNITMDHAVQLVGYGTDKSLGLDYWLVRNSWSAGWGEEGFIRLVKERGTPKCGWNNDWDTQGGGCKGDPNTVWACGQCGILFDTLYPNIVV